MTHKRLELTASRNSPLSDSMVTRQRQMQSMRTYHAVRYSACLISHSGCEPLTPDDIAEVVVFTAGRRENVVVADTLVFPNHQVRLSSFVSSQCSGISLCCTRIGRLLIRFALLADGVPRLLPPSCTRSLDCDNHS